MNRKSILIIVVALVLVVLGPIGCGTSQPAPTGSAADRRDGAAPDSGNGVSAAVPGSSAEQGASAPEPPKPAPGKGLTYSPEAAQGGEEMALVVQRQMQLNPQGTSLNTPAGSPSAPQSQSAPGEAETAAAANRESAPAPDYGTPTNFIPPPTPVTSGASSSTGAVSADKPAEHTPSALEQLQQADAASASGASFADILSTPPPVASGAGASSGPGAFDGSPIGKAKGKAHPPPPSPAPPSSAAPPANPPGSSAADASGGSGAPIASRPAERETTAAEQQQAQAEAARAQAQAAYEKARAQTEAAQQQTHDAAQANTTWKTQTMEFDEDTITGELKKPGAAGNTPPPPPPNVSSLTSAFGAPAGQPKPASPPPPAGSQSGQLTQSVMAAFTPQGASLNTAATNPSVPTRSAPPLAPVERYPNIEAPDTVTAGQEIAVQVSLTSEQISPETKILSGVESGGKLQLQMAEGERQWTLTVNLTVPGMEITRGGTNTAEISIERDSDSGVAVFYLRAQPLDAANSAGRRDTRILATLWHEGALLARLSRPLTIVSAAPAATANAASGASSLRAAAPAPTAHTLSAAAATQPGATPAAAVQLDPTLAAPDLTIIENRVGNTLRLVFYSVSSPPVEADIADPDALHAWINSHFKELASRGRGATAEPAEADSGAAQLHAQDYLNGFGAELYDRFAPQAFKDLLSKMLDAGHPAFSSIQIYSDDPSLPWELMRPKLANNNERMDFLGATFSIARWPVTRRGMMRPPQSLMVEESVVIAPGYQGGKSLQAAGLELTTLKKMRGFTEVAGSYAAVRQLAGHPPQGFVHFAGHGAVMDKDGVPQFAILLEDSEMDPGTWQALATSGTAVHPLFFFNACDVGESRQFMNDVDGWAPALLDGGASGYIGALWPVSDTTAELFASTFYDSIAKELALGEHSSVAGILTRTREEVFRKTQDPTALAYVFYGDPKLTLTKPK